ncbi:hypothetical protein BC833DRAFT_577924 [Globomyces pollinis-pini]|nr:hypothetical protein BC833DRAFT_577924 [Globomyces pollinis-pini]
MKFYKQFRVHFQRCYSSPPIREYFYEIDHHGQLFLAETKHKNFTSCFKDITFLDFFYKRLTYNDQRNQYYPEYQYISPCGREMNYVKSLDAPIVFHKLIDNQLHYAGSLTIPFKPELYVSNTTGRIISKRISSIVGFNQVQLNYGTIQSRF